MGSTSAGIAETLDFTTKPLPLALRIMVGVHNLLERVVAMNNAPWPQELPERVKSNETRHAF